MNKAKKWRFPKLGKKVVLIRGSPFLLQGSCGSLPVSEDPLNPKP